MKNKIIIFIIYTIFTSHAYSQSEIIFEKSDGSELRINYINEHNQVKTHILPKDSSYIQITENNLQFNQKSSPDTYYKENIIDPNYIPPEQIWMRTVQAKKKDYKKIERMLKRGQNVNANVIDNNNLLILGAMQNDLEQVNLALKYKANINRTNKNGETALHWAIKSNEITTRLLQHNAKNKNPNAFVNKKSKAGRSALHFACTYTADNMVIDLLINNGAEIDTLDKDGRTPAYFAVAFEKWDALEQLLKRGAKLDIEDKNGLSVENLLMRRMNIKNMIRFYPYLSVEGKRSIRERLSDYRFSEDEVNPFKK